ncbi:MAG: hypothetical protein IKL28_01035 [Lachnospiraceae bacterium]|nr:hypothetical protein [Lachnospiraceae bacterium]
MNEEKQNQTYYQETFREVHAPQDLAERLMKMEERTNKKKAGSAAKWIAIAAVAAVVLFAGSNGIAYATTGSTWVETMVYKLTLRNVEYDVDLKEWKRGNGESFYNGKFQENNGDESFLWLDEDGKAFVYSDINTSFLRSEDRVYFVDKGYMEIDITEELQKNGQAVGSYEKNGSIKEYKIWEENGQLRMDLKIIYEDGTETNYHRQELVSSGNSEPITDPVHGGSVASPTPTPEPMGYYLD